MAAPAKTKKTADVVAYARELCEQAARIRNPDSDVHDPYAKPYAPSESTARRLVDSMGAEAAYGELVHRAREAKRLDDERRAEDTAKERKLRNERAEQDRDNAALLEGLSYGQRIDRGLTALAVISEADTASYDSTGGGDPQPVLVVRPTDLAHAIKVAAAAVSHVEILVQRAVRRTLRSPDENRDDRLARFVKSGLTASMIAIADRTQGTVRQIQARIDEMQKAEELEEAA